MSLRSIRPTASLLFAQAHRLRRVGKGVGTIFPYDNDSRAPCPRVHRSMRNTQKNAWARRTMDFATRKSSASAFAHPTSCASASRLLLSRTDALAQVEEALPWIACQEAQPLAQIVDAEMIGTHAFRQLLPGQRRRHRRLLACACRIGGDRGRATAVAEIVDENAPAPCTLRHRGDVTLRVVLAHRFRNRSGERLGGIPIEARGKWHHDVQALAARGFHEAVKPDLLEALPHLARRRDDGVPGNILARTEVEDQPVGLLQPLDGRSPRMDLDHARLHETDEAGEVVDREHRLAIAGVDAPDPLAEAMPGMLGEEALFADARRRAQQTERPADHMRQDPLGDIRIELREALLGDAGFLPEDALGMGEPHAGEISSRRLRLGCSGGRHLQRDVGGWLVLAQALVRGDENEPVPPPGPELDLADEPRPRAAHPRTPGRRQRVDPLPP